MMYNSGGDIISDGLEDLEFLGGVTMAYVPTYGTEFMLTSPIGKHKKGQVFTVDSVRVGFPNTQEITCIVSI